MLMKIKDQTRFLSKFQKPLIYFLKEKMTTGLENQVLEEDKAFKLELKSLDLRCPTFKVPGNFSEFYFLYVLRNKTSLRKVF